MRELTKSMTSFSWAMSLFGLRQMACLFDPRSWGSSSSTFQAVTRCTEDQLGPTTQSLFRAGDNLQRGLVDLMFNLFTFGAWGSNQSQGGGDGRRSGRGQGSYGQGQGSYGQGQGSYGQGSYGEGDAIQRSAQWSADAMSRTAQAGADVMQQTAQAGADAVRQGMSGMGSNAGQSGQGWGPVTGGGGR